MQYQISLKQLATFIAATLSCGMIAPSLASETEKPIEVSPYIVNGEEALVDDFPSFVSLFVDSIEIDGIYYPSSYCGGTLLDSEHVLTAAHCLYGSVVNQLFTVVVPKLQDENDYPYGSVEQIRISAVFYPDSYIDSTSLLLPNDIAILKLEQAVSVSNYISIPTDESYRTEAESFLAVGHGNTATGQSTTSLLQKATLSWVDNQTCASNFTNGSNLTDKQICFTGDYSEATKLKAGTCQGDSGGPIYWNENGTQVQVGITSFGPATCGNATSKVTAVYTEITDYRNWINSVLNGLEQPKRVSSDRIRQDYVDTYGSITNDVNGIVVPITPESSGGGGTLSHYLLTLLGFLALFRLKNLSWSRLVFRASDS